MKIWNWGRSRQSRQPQRRQSPSRNRANYQALESRQMLAGDVVVFHGANDHLYIRGDAAANQIEIRGTEGGAIEVIGTNGTTVNGGASFRVENAQNTLEGLRIRLGRGDDSVFVENLTISQTALIYGGAGADSMGFYQTQVEGNLIILGEQGNDAISVDEVMVGENLVITTDHGHDTIGLDAVDIGGYTLIISGSGNDRLAISDSIHRDSAFIFTHGGADFVGTDATEIQGFVVLDTGAGADNVYLEDTLIDGQAFARGGNGQVDQLELDGTTRFTANPVVRGFEGNDVAGGRLQRDAVYNDLIVDGARLGTIVEIAALNPNFSTLVGALQSTGLDSALAGNGPFTVFAPLNSAFDKISGTVQGLTLEQLANVLRFHVASGVVNSSQLVMMTSVPTLLGQNISVNTSGGNVVLNGNATLAATDIRAKNGIIHVLNDVLVPTL